ncbi:helix-turn-helix domain-containing protein [Brevundimonas naejangsanensis]|jgi:transcriptional regulator with XRE-family HTH domain|uniref:helix-turn-helix domain-containing protein n=1 Tax=Brevundimonas naejangsanensis TaxID=588932 RepID=UPI003D061E18
MDPAQRQSQSATLAAALRLIRTHRRIRKADLAQAMGMSPRNYDLFEAGKGRINLERIYRFAEITKSDYHAILAALAFGSPAFALNTADNQMMTILMAALQDFEAEFGDLVGELDSRTIINVFTRALKELALQAVRRDDAAEAWLKRRVERLVPPSTPGPDDSPADPTP